LKIVLLIGAAVLGVIALILVVGWLLPKQHVAARALALHRKPEEVFQLISDFKAAPTWRSDVQQIEMLEAVNGHVRYREKSANGTLTFEVMESSPPSRMVTRIADEGLPFGGRWIFEIAQVGDGCRLNITERGEIYNPVFRFVSRFLLGYERTLDAYLQNVSHKFGEGAVPEAGAAAP
jgi:hypothetical protein